jgi:hypothetical protein
MEDRARDGELVCINPCRCLGIATGFSSLTRLIRCKRLRGVETIETDGSEVEVVREVLQEVDRSIHVRPVLYMDAELPFVTENDAPGVEQYRGEIRGVLGDRPVSSIPHEAALSKIDEAGKTFHILVLKTQLAVPYTSVFIQLDCKYWSPDAEARLRQAMKSQAQ